MNKRALIIAGTGSMISQFNMTNIEVLQEYGYTIDIACDFFNGNNIDEKEKVRFKQELKDKNIEINQIDFSRNVFNIFGHIKAYKQIDNLRKKHHYDIVHAHMPISAFLTKLVFRKERKNGTKVMYTAHGFHFFKGAPLINWILYYPLEKISSRWTDVLILINKEDYNLAKNKMHASKTVYTPGIGVDIDRFTNTKLNNNNTDKFILVSVGELIKKKNQKIVIDALHKLNNPNIYYYIVGIGQDEDKLKQLIKSYNFENNVKLLGYRKDVEDVLATSHCFIHTPTREGLGIAPLEAMSMGLPLIASNTNGIRDYAIDGVTGYLVNPRSVEEVAEAIDKMYNNKDFRKQCGKNNIEIAKHFSKYESKKAIGQVYKDASKI